MNTIRIPDSILSFQTAITIRHAERYPIDKMVDALYILLTDKGKLDAYRLGQRLFKLSPVKLYHSPVPRCKQTAESISEGILDKNCESQISGQLFDLGGPYITGDWNEIVYSVKKIGQTDFLRKWFDDKFPDDMIMPINEAAKIQLQILIDQLTSEESSTINVTHDWNIMILREYYFNLRHEDIGVPGFLDGIIAYINDNKLCLLYHEDIKIIDI